MLGTRLNLMLLLLLHVWVLIGHHDSIRGGSSVAVDRESFFDLDRRSKGRWVASDNKGASIRAFRLGEGYREAREAAREAGASRRGVGMFNCGHLW